MPKLARWRTITALGLAALGFAVIGYPALANWLNARAQANQLASWARAVERADGGELIEQLAAAERYNADLHTGIKELKGSDQDSYYSQLRIPNTEVMASVAIPDIGVFLPVYHGTNAEVLDIGVGHLRGTSLPVGGPNTHAALTAHSGIESNRLFTDLNQVEIGGVIEVNTAGRRLVYEVDQITIITADSLTEFDYQPGEDLLTLVTCTPIGINSHRLLVRSHRVSLGQMPQQGSAARSEAYSPFPLRVLLCAGFLTLAVLGIVIVGIRDGERESQVETGT